MSAEEPSAASSGAQQAGPAKRPAGRAAQPGKAGKRQALGRQQSGPVQKSLTAFLKPHNRQAAASAIPAGSQQARPQSAPVSTTEPVSSAVEPAAACPGLQNRPEVALQSSQAAAAGALAEAAQQAEPAASQAEPAASQAQGLSGGSSAWTEADLEEAHVRAMAEEEEQGEWGGGAGAAGAAAQNGLSCSSGGVTEQVRPGGSCFD